MWRLSVVIVLLTQLTGCGYNTFQTQDEQIKASWAEVVNQYQRRADLIPNLVETVRGFARQEQEVLIGVTEARAKVGTVQATPEVPDDPQAFAQFQAAQGELSSALSRLMVVVEALPRPEVRCELPRPAGTARGHGESHHRRAQSLHRSRAGLQRHRAPVPEQPDREGTRL